MLLEKSGEINPERMKRLSQSALGGGNQGPSAPGWAILKEFSPGITLEGIMLKLKLQYFGHLMEKTETPVLWPPHGYSLEKTLMLGGIGPDWASLELSPSVESCGCGLGPSPVRLWQPQAAHRALF